MNAHSTISPAAGIAFAAASLAAKIAEEVEPDNHVGDYLAQRLGAAAVTLAAIEPLNPGQTGPQTPAERNDLSIAQRTWSRALAEWMRWRRHRAALTKKSPKPSPQIKSVTPNPLPSTQIVPAPSTSPSAIKPQAVIKPHPAASTPPPTPPPATPAAPTLREPRNRRERRAWDARNRRRAQTEVTPFDVPAPTAPDAQPKRMPALEPALCA